MAVPQIARDGVDEARAFVNRALAARLAALPELADVATDQQPGGLATKELRGAVDRLGQSEPAAGGLDGRGVADLGPDRDDVGQKGPPRCTC